MGTDSLFNKGAETTRYLCKRMNLDPSLTYIPKLAITELLEENIGENLCDLGLSRVLRYNTKTTAHKRK